MTPREIELQMRVAALTSEVKRLKAAGSTMRQARDGQGQRDRASIRGLTAAAGAAARIRMQRDQLMELVRDIITPEEWSGVVNVLDLPTAATLAAHARRDARRAMIDQLPDGALKRGLSTPSHGRTYEWTGRGK